MKKSLIVAASLAAMSASAMAANVEIFGNVDYFAAVGRTGHDYTTVLSSGGMTASHFGFKGMEPITPSMQVMFQMDAAFLADTGKMGGAGDSGSLWTRECWVGIHHNDFGMLSFGRQYTPHFLTYAMTDITGLSLGSADSPFFYPSPTGTNGDAPEDFVRHSNSIFYASPTMGGVTVFAYAALGENSGSSTKDNIYNIAANYVNGPLFVMGSFLYQNNAKGSLRNAGYALDGTHPEKVAPLAERTNSKYYNFAATYDLGVTKPMLQFTYRDGDDTALQPDWYMVQIGAATPLFGGTLSTSAAYLKNKSVAQADAVSYGIKYVYPLSKRTKVYGGLSGIVNEKAANFSIEAGPDSSLHIPNGKAGDDQHVLFVGINHAF